VVALHAGGARADDAGAKPEPPRIGALKYDEDYSYLRDPDNRSGAWWERLKFVPLDSDGRVFLTFGDELRLRYEHYWNNNFGSGKLPTEDYLRYRQLPYVGLNLGPELRVFAELQAAYAARSPIVKNPFLDQTAIDLLQGFVDWRIPIGHGHLTLRAGRQVLFYGSGRLVNQGPNIRTSFDGGVVSWELERWRVDALYARPVDPRSGYFDDRPDGSRRIWSVYGTRKLPQIAPDAGVDLYYFGFQNSRATFNQGTRNERRHTIGARLFGTPLPWQGDLEANFQFGRFGDADIRAFSIALDQGYTFTSVRMKPFFGLRTAVLSGDGDARDHTLGTFNPMFAQGGYFGENGVLGPANLILIRPLVALQLGSGVTLTGSGTIYFRERQGDGIYDLGLGVLRPDGGSHASLVGSQADLAAGWAVNRNLSFAASSSILWPDGFVRDTGPAKTVYFFGGHMAFSY
jgi:alginate export protein